MRKGDSMGKKIETPLDRQVSAYKRGRCRVAPAMSYEEFKKLPIVLDASMVSALLGLTTRQVINLAGENKLPARRIGCQWRFSKSEIAEHLGLI